MTPPFRAPRRTAPTTSAGQSGLRVRVCSTPGIFGITERSCDGCGTRGEHISHWHGPHYGYDHHCLSCGVTDRDGNLRPLTEETEQYWMAVAETCVLPAELFERYVAADNRMASGLRNQTAVAERYSMSLLVAVAAEVAEHLDAVAQREAGTQ